MHLQNYISRNMPSTFQTQRQEQDWGSDGDKQLQKYRMGKYEITLDTNKIAFRQNHVSITKIKIYNNLGKYFFLIFFKNIVVRLKPFCAHQIIHNG